MARTPKPKAALFVDAPPTHKKKSAAARRLEEVELAEHRGTHMPITSNALKLKLDHLKTFSALTENQTKFFDAYRRGDYFIGLLGSPGTGKTFIAMLRAIEEVLDRTNSFKQVVIVRSAVQTRDQGFMPGSLDEKQEIYEQPYSEISATLFNIPQAWARLKEQGHCRFITTTAIRGISIDDAVVIVDECQNMTFQELHTVMTRVGYRSKIIFSGDGKQNDLIKSKYDHSGLDEFLKIVRSMPEFTEVNFTSDDIVRSSLVKQFIVACESFGV